jgi:hypothetical protein
MKRQLAMFVAIVALVNAGQIAHSAISIGPRQDALTQEQQDQLYHQRVAAAEIDLQKKIAAGQARYNQREAYRENLEKGMQTVLQMRKQVVNMSPGDVSEGPESSVLYTLAGWVIALMAGGLLWLHQRKHSFEGGGYAFSLSGALSELQANVEYGTSFLLPPRRTTGQTEFRERKAEEPIIPPAPPSVCYNCHKSTPTLDLREVNFCGEDFSLCPACAREHEAAWAT